MEPLIGIFVALAAILLGNMLEGGHASSIVGGPAMLIVLGGTIGATMVQFPLATISESIKIVSGTFKKCHYDLPKMIEEIVDYANRARRDGILALEKVASTVSDPFLAKALTMAVDGVDSATLRDTMEVTISQHEEHGEDAAKVFEALGGYCPTIGIIGAVLGLIHVMSNLSDIAAVGAGIAAAFVATIYGVAFANVVFLPMAGRIKLRVREEATARVLMLTGVLAIQEGMNPKLVRDRLAEFVHDHGHGKAGAAAPATA
ncbi:MAG: flagellar motor protein [Myxococcales bacterium]|nr:flagellar motor protein [Myxococcales bacterium]